MTKTSKEEQKKIIFDNNQLALSLFGEQGKNLKIFEELLDVGLHVKGNEVIISGHKDAVEVTGTCLEQLYKLLDEGFPLHPSDIEFAIQILKNRPETNLKTIFLDKLTVSSGRRVITPKTLTQKAYVDAIRKNDIVFGVGPAGTGKTYLAMAMAVAAYVREEVQRIVLTRPAVEAGERLGFLPGDLAEKVNPYLRPLYDALYDMLSFEKVSRLLERGTIEVAPLAFMRGRTLNDAFIILDEAQNTTSEQMKMFLTRLGYGSKAVITGDITQIDLPETAVSGLVEAISILKDIKGISIIQFSKKDVVRHRLVSRIIEAYEHLEQRRLSKKEG